MMLSPPRPHDLLWLSSVQALEDIQDKWVDDLWHYGLPVVVRRDTDTDGRIPVGVRGMKRGQRAAGWVQAAAITRLVMPETLADKQTLLRSSHLSQPSVQAAITLTDQHWPWSWSWGITGSTGYALATNIPVLHADSDLDLLIRAPSPPDREALLHWQSQTVSLPCRVDTQLATPFGAVALSEWLRGGRVLLKTSQGPRLTKAPWNSEE